MEKWEGQQSRKQKYDMGVQKEISQIQVLQTTSSDLSALLN